MCVVAACRRHRATHTATALPLSFALQLLLLSALVYISLHTISTCLCSMQRHPQRLPFFCLVNRSTAACVQTSLHPHALTLTHPDTVPLAAMLDIARSFAANARWSDALSLLEEAQPLHAAQLGESHTGTMSSAMELSVALQVPRPAPSTRILFVDTPRHVTSAILPAAL